MKKHLNKKTYIGIAVVLILSMGLGIGYLLNNQTDSKDKVYVEKVATLMGYDQSASNVYMGKVEATQVQTINKTGGTIDEIFVSVGDHVSEGDALFSYDSHEAQMQIQKLNLDIEGYRAQMKTLTSQIETLKQEKENAPETEQYQYIMDIQAKELEIKQLEASQSGASQSIASYQKQINDATVTSKIDGIVKAINEEDTSQAFMSIMATGAYKVKGEVNEQHVFMLTEGADVIIRSRIDETKQWKGKIQMVDKENTITSGQESFEDPNQLETSTKYPFYVTLDQMDGLLLGQHVYIEMDEGQNKPLDGVWIDASYVVMDNDEKPFVWKANKRHQLEKHPITLGKTDEERMLVEIKKGLSLEDMITWPMEGLYEGISCVTNPEAVDYTSPLYNQEEGESDAA